MTLDEKLVALKQIIHDATMMIESLKEECPHPNYIATYDSFVGSYDNQDEYWVTLNCPDCGHSSHYYSDDEEQSKVYYAKHERVVQK